MSMVIRTANKEDVNDIVNLLNQGKLSIEGLEGNLENFLVVEDVEYGEVIGTAGIEKADEKIGILRSLVLKEGKANRNLVLSLLKILLKTAVQKELENVYLLTRTTSLFEMLGFQKVEKEQLPPALLQSAHFSQRQPELSTIMVYKKVDNLSLSIQN